MAKPVIKTQAGQLYISSEKDTQQLAKDAGITAANISPLGNAILGANPDQAKMAGTPAQKTTSLRESIKAGTSLAESLNKTQAPQAQTEQSKQTIKDVQNLGGLTSFSDRVGQIAQKKADEAVKQQVAFDVTKAKDNPALAAILLKLNQNPADSNNLVEAAKVLGMSAEDVSSGKLFAALKDQFGSQIATTAPSVNLSMFQPDDWKALGFTGSSDFASKIGLNPKAVLLMTPEQAKQAIETFRQTKLNQADNLRALLSDPFASPAAKENARQELLQMGQQGTLSAESQAKQTTQSLQKAIQAPVIKTNIGQQEILRQQKLNEQGIEKLKQIQQERSKQAEVGGGRLNDAAMKFIDKTWGGPLASAYKTPTQTPLIAGLNTSKALSDNQKGDIVNVVNQLAGKVDPVYMNQLLQMKPEKLTQLLEGNPAKFINNLAGSKQIKSFNNLTSSDEVSKFLGFTNTKELVQTIKDATIMQKSGLFGEVDPALNRLMSEVVLNSDGSLNTKATVQALQSKTPSNIQQAAVWDDPRDLKSQLGSYSTQTQDEEKTAAKADRILSTSTVIPTEMTEKELEKIKDEDLGKVRLKLDKWIASAKVLAKKYSKDKYLGKAMIASIDKKIKQLEDMYATRKAKKQATNYGKNQYQAGGAIDLDVDSNIGI